MITIVGGGLSGLAIAGSLLDLAKDRGDPPPELRLLEADAAPGGKIRSVTHDGFICEGGPNGWLDREETTRTLCDRLDLQEQLQPAAGAFKKRYLYRAGRLHTVDMSPGKFLASPLLPTSAKLRLALEPFIPRRRATTDESVASFGRRRIGDTAFRILVDAMQSGIYAGDPEQMSVQSCFPRIVEIERTYGSLIRGMVSLMIARRSTTPQGGAPTGHLTSLQGGLQGLTDRLAAKLGPNVLQTGARVISIHKRDTASGYDLHTEDGRHVTTDVLILACPAYVASRLLAPLDARLATLLQRIDYAPLMVVSLGFARAQVGHALDGFGFLAPRQEGLRSIGTLFSSAIFPGRAPAGHALLRVMIGGARDPAVKDLDDDTIARIALDELRPILDIHGAPVMTRVFRHPRAIPQYTLGHATRLADIEARAEDLGQLILAGNAYHGVGINDCIKIAPTIAERALRLMP